MALRSALKPGNGQDLSKIDRHNLFSYNPTGIVLVHGTDRRFRGEPFDRVPLAVEAALADRVPLLVFNAGRPTKSVQELKAQGIDLGDMELFRSRDGLVYTWMPYEKRRMNRENSRDVEHLPNDKKDILAFLKEKNISVASVPYSFDDHESRDVFSKAFLAAGQIPLVFCLHYSSTMTLGNSMTLAPEEWQVRVNTSVSKKEGEIHLFNFAAHYQDGWTGLALPILIPAYSMFGTDKSPGLIIPTYMENSISIINLGGRGKENLTDSMPDLVESEKRGFFGEAVAAKVANAIESIWNIVNQKTDAWNAYRGEVDSKFEAARAKLQPGQELNESERKAIFDSVKKPEYEGELRDVVAKFFNGVNKT